MAELKTAETDADVDAFLAGVEDTRRRTDAMAVRTMMERVTGEPARMWGTSIIGFGRYRYKYASGREGVFFLTGVSPRKQALTIHIMTGFERYAALMARLGTFKTGKSCLYVKSLDDIDPDVFEDLVRRSVAVMRETHETPGPD